MNALANASFRLGHPSKAVSAQTLTDPQRASLTAGSLPPPAAAPAAAQAHTQDTALAPTPAAPQAPDQALNPAFATLDAKTAQQPQQAATITSDSDLAPARVPHAGAVHMPPRSLFPAAVKPIAGMISSVVHQQLDTPSSSFFGTVTEVGWLTDACWASLLTPV